ncbi:odorant receptor 33c-like [Aethina tumida]|uniref:odorant receptor 33c-like n=1 Tax=Aethina tumida TaxID=116153 RepID=UPI002147C084|nr:odorant receptor 33c-like [Aethina tumida]
MLETLFLIEQSMSYQHMLAAQTYFCLVLCFSIAGLDFLVCTLCVYLQIQYKILNYNVQNLNIGEIRTTHEEKLCHTKLIKYIKHHDFLLRYMDLFNRTFSHAFFFHVMYVLFSLCSELYMVSVATKASEIFRCMNYSFGIVVQMFILHCIPAQSLSNEAEQLPFAIYSSNWYARHSVNMRNSIRMMLRRSQAPVAVYGGKFYKINYETCMYAFKTSLSFYMSITTIGQKDKNTL